MLVSALLFTLARIAPPASYQHHIGASFTAAVLPASRLETAVMTGSRKRLRAAGAAGAAGVAAAPCAASPHDKIDASHDAIADIEELPAGLVNGYRQHQGLLYHDFSQDEVSPWQATFGARM